MILRVYANEAADWFVAESIEEAVALYKQWLIDTKCTLADEDLTDACEGFYRCNDNKILGIIPDEDQSLPPIKKTCAEWAASNGKGFLCSENY